MYAASVVEQPALAAAWQGGLFDGGCPAIDSSFAGLRRVMLGDDSWYDYLPGWLRGADTVFDELADGLVWRQRRVPMYERMVDEPRLTWWWTSSTRRSIPMPVMDEMLVALNRRYRLSFDSIGCNYYRDGRDSVAWHGDRHRHWVTDPVIAIVSVGKPRPFLLRPRGGGRAQRLELGHGDLFVMGGASQDRWEHAVPKASHAGPRISITYRHGASAPIGDGVWGRKPPGVNGTGGFSEPDKREDGGSVRA